MYLGSMDWHALTTAYKSPKDVAHWRREMIAEWLAWGIDPEKCTIFIQSEVPAHVELYMYFSMLTPLSWLERVPTWKDAEEEAKRTETHNLGRFVPTPYFRQRTLLFMKALTFRSVRINWLI
jgi:tryptophanyl-tRNA synthetase